MQGVRSLAVVYSLFLTYKHKIMKKKQLSLERKLYLNKVTIGYLNAKAQQLVNGGGLVAAPKPTTSMDYRRCNTTIEEFRYSYEVQCPDTVTGPCTGQFCITTGPTC